MKSAHITVLFFVFLLLDIIIITISPQLIPYKGFFPYKEIVDGYGLPQWISSQANFDGAQYLLIASQGYQQFQQALFPLYPLLITILGPVFLGNHLIAGLILSVVSFYGGLQIFNAYLKEIGKKPEETFWIILFLLVFPTSFYFHTVYTESVFFLLISTSLYAFAKKQYLLAGAASIMTSLTRLMGIFLMPVFLVQRIMKDWAEHVSHEENKYHSLSQIPGSVITSMRNEWREKRYTLSFVFACVAPVFGLGIYMTYLWATYDNPLYFIDAQSAFDANRSTDSFVLLPQVLYRYVRILLTVSGYPFYQALMELVIFSGVFTVLLADAVKRWKRRTEKDNGIYVSLLLFSFINIILPTLTGTLSSTTRYALMSLSFFLFVGEIQNTKVKTALAATLFALHAVMLGLYAQGYFVG
jgi:hypothetical protein